MRRLSPIGLWIAPRDLTAPGPWIVFEDVTLRIGDALAFGGLRWTWNRGEQWAVLGPNGSGTSYFASAVAGRLPVAAGEIHHRFDLANSGLAPENAVGLLSPQVQRALAMEEASFYQSRWNSGIGEGRRTVGQFLSPQSVFDINPYEIGAGKAIPSTFRHERRALVGTLGVEALWRRKLAFLSNGEQRKVLLAYTLLRKPRLLILDDPLGGLDGPSRTVVLGLVRRLMRAGLPVLIVASRSDEIPPESTHLLLVDGLRVVAQGDKAAMLELPLARSLGGAGPCRLGRRALVPPAVLPQNHCNEAPVLELDGVSIRAGRKWILRGVDWTVRPGENWALLGPNGSGKTTLLGLLQGDHPRAHALEIRLFGSKPGTRWWRTRRRIGWVSPELHFHYPGGWSCLDVVCSGWFNTLGLFRRCNRSQRSAARRWLRRVGLGSEERADFAQLALAEQRLVLLARAVVKGPALLLLDEPCQGLDGGRRDLVLAAVDHVVESTGASLIYVTHYAQEMPSCITHILRLSNGRVVSKGGS